MINNILYLIMMLMNMKFVESLSEQISYCVALENVQSQ